MAQQSAELRLQVNGPSEASRMHLDATKLAQFDGRRYASVDLPGLGGKLRLASLSARRAFEFRKLMEQQNKGENVEFEITRLLLIGSVVDDEGRPVFDEKSAEAFLDRVSPTMAAGLVTEVTKLQSEGKADAGNPSGASPNAA